MSRNERAEGLEVAAVATEDPAGRFVAGCSSERRRPWRAAMRLEVAAWESGFFWWRTDDGHSACAFCTRECPAEVFLRRHYVLWQCTDETSA